MEILLYLSACFCSCSIAVFVNWLNKKWYSIPLSEEEGGSILYIKKELFK